MKIYFIIINYYGKNDILCLNFFFPAQILAYQDVSKHICQAALSFNNILLSLYSFLPGGLSNPFIIFFSRYECLRNSWNISGVEFEFYKGRCKDVFNEVLMKWIMSNEVKTLIFNVFLGKYKERHMALLSSI
jgi:hypothetical protein